MYKLDFSVMIPFIPILIKGLGVSLIIGISSFIIAVLLSIIVGAVRFNKPNNIFLKIILKIMVLKKKNHKLNKKALMN